MSPPDLEDWQKPSKVARRHSPPTEGVPAPGRQEEDSRVDMSGDSLVGRVDSETGLILGSKKRSRFSGSLLDAGHGGGRGARGSRGRHGRFRAMGSQARRAMGLAWPCLAGARAEDFGKAPVGGGLPLFPAHVGPMGSTDGPAIGPDPRAELAGEPGFQFSARALGVASSSEIPTILGSLAADVELGDGVSSGPDLGTPTMTSTCVDCPMRDAPAPVEPGLGDSSVSEEAVSRSTDHSTVVQRVRAAVLRVVSGPSVDEGMRDVPHHEAAMDPTAQRVDVLAADLSDFSP